MTTGIIVAYVVLCICGIVYVMRNYFLSDEIESGGIVEPENSAEANRRFKEQQQIFTVPKSGTYHIDVETSIVYDPSQLKDKVFYHKGRFKKCRINNNV